jgi:hypothetical protein
MRSFSLSSERTICGPFIKLTDFLMQSTILCWKKQDMSSAPGQSTILDWDMKNIQTMLFNLLIKLREL